MMVLAAFFPHLMKVRCQISRSEMSETLEKDFPQKVTQGKTIASKIFVG
jgi:hypothetical protein